jgi:hypothetical protein
MRSLTPRGRASRTFATSWGCAGPEAPKKNGGDDSYWTAAAMRGFWKDGSVARIRHRLADLGLACAAEAGLAL